MRRLRILTVISAMCLGASPAVAADVSGTVQAAGKPVSQAVLWLELSHPPVFTQATKVVLDQRNLSFTPQVLVVRVGTTVDFPNNDKVFHNVFSFRDGKKFDLGMYPIGTSKRVVFDRPGLARIFCNIHPNMAAYVMAVDTPFYAVSNERGQFTIAGVPNGTYTYHVWRPGGQPLTGTFAVDGERRLDVQW